MPDSGAPTLFNTKRTDLLELYSNNGVPFIATTRGMHSVRSLRFDVQNLDLATSTIGYLVAPRGQEIIFYNYGQNDSIELSGNPQHRANASDTMLTKGSRTTAAADLAIEWITAGARAVKMQYQQHPAVAGVPPFHPDFTIDPTAQAQLNQVPVLSMLEGRVALVDPFGLCMPAEVGSSATLQHVLYHAVAPHITCKFEWDNADRTEKVGTFDQFAQGSGAAYLNSNGNPDTANKFRIPEGFIWAREGQPAGELQVVCRLENDVVIPYTPVVQALTGVQTVLEHVWVEITMRMGGILLRVPGSN